jgi:deoxyguanosine kinase
MKKQHQAVLAIGSNEGDRKQALVEAIRLINSEIGTVVNVSAVYESPAWGFEGADFLNGAVLVHTLLDAPEILPLIIGIETRLGRTRPGSERYAARTIDIDILAFDSEVVATDALQVPHPRMRERLFVLKPLQDVLPDYTDPVTGEGITALIAACPDTGRCEKAGTLEWPLRDVFGSSNYIAIEGNIGAGKTTLATRIAEDFNAKTVLERFADNPFLPKFYKDQSRYAFPLEMSFLADRYQQLSDDIAQFDLFRDFIVSDYHIFKSLIFAKVTLADDEYRLYRKLFDIIYKETPRPDLYIYLYQNTERLLENIRKRGRSYEQEIPGEYLESINKGYLEFIKSQPGMNVLVIDVSQLDFVRNQPDYLFILEEIRRKISGTA